MRTSCQALPNVFGVYRKTLLTSKPSLNDLYISWVTAESWFMQESPDLNLYSLNEISSFSIKNLNISLKINFWKNFSLIGSKDTGLQFFKHCFSSFYEWELYSFFFHSDGEQLFSIDNLKMSFSGLQTELQHNYSRQILTLSWPCTLLGS